jgi:hypothetical protein
VLLDHARAAGGVHVMRDRFETALGVLVLACCLGRHVGCGCGCWWRRECRVVNVVATRKTDLLFYGSEK